MDIKTETLHFLRANYGGGIRYEVEITGKEHGTGGILIRWPVDHAGNITAPALALKLKQFMADQMPAKELTLKSSKTKLYRKISIRWANASH